MRLRKRQRLVLLVVALLLLGGASTLVLLALSDSVAFFASPSDIAAGKVDPDRRFRLGGLVVEGSVQRGGEDGLVTFALTDQANVVQVRYQGLLPDLFREGQGIVAQGVLGEDGVFVASEVLAKHDETYMPPEVAEALKEAGVWRHNEAAPARPGRAESEVAAMIGEIGHYALVLALGLALIQGTLPLLGRCARRCRPDRARPLERARPVRVSHHRVCRADPGLRGLRLLDRQRRRQLAFQQAADLQGRRGLGQSRGLAGPVGLDPGAVRRRRGAARQQPAAAVPGAGAGGAGADRPRLSRLHAVHLQPVRAPRSGAARWPGLQSDPAGPGARRPSADAVRGLRRALDGLRLRDRGADRGPGRRQLGALGAALDARRLGCLTLGIALGSYWAYYELGWGGWWFWDPVENASFMPWLAATALLHSAIVVEKRDSLKSWTILLAILAFSLSLLGTFLVRSGVLTSVHAFAVDPARGVFVLALLAIAIGGSLALFAWRAPALQGRGLFAPISREGALLLNNLLLATACATVLLGTLYPLLLEAVGGPKISVGPPYFNATFVPLMVPLLIAIPIGSMLAWKRGDLAGVIGRLKIALLIVAVALLAQLGVSRGADLLAAGAMTLAIWVMVGTLCELISRVQLLRLPPAQSWQRARGLPRASYAMSLAHFGVGVLVAGVTASSAWQSEAILVMQPGATAELAGYSFTLARLEDQEGPNYVRAGRSSR